MNEKICLTVTEAAAALGISKPTMYRLMNRRDCDFAYQIGRRRVIDRRKLEEWSAKQAERCISG